MGTTQVRLMRKYDVQETLGLLNQALGEGYVSAVDLGGTSMAFVAIDDTGTIVGAATGCIVSSIGEAVPVDQVGTVESLVPEVCCGSTGVLKSVAVSAGMQGRGIGLAISEAVTDALFQNGAGCVVSIGWTDDDGCHIEGTLIKLGYAKRGEINDFWLQDSLEQEYSCPSCEGACKCSAIIFVMGD